MRVQRILVTGASGLLGNAMVRHFREKVDLLPLAFRNVSHGMLKGDLTDPDCLERLDRESWDALIHCAALRSPDYCETHPGEAEQLNTRVPVALARMAARRGARMIHVSTDYVFPGTCPPYRETDPCHPVNLYGKTKRLAEEGIAEVAPGAVIMRIGALYGVPSPGIPSPMLEEAIQVVLEGKPVEVDHRIKRYPLWVDDVAEVADFILGRDAVNGIVHVGSARAATRYELALAVATLMGRSADHVRPSDRDLTRSAVRPVDVGMAMDRLRSWGGPVPRDYPETLPEILRQTCQVLDAM